MPAPIWVSISSRHSVRERGVAPLVGWLDPAPRPDCQTLPPGTEMARRLRLGRLNFVVDALPPR
jgi:hypothetical protein